MWLVVVARTVSGSGKDCFHCEKHFTLNDLHCVFESLVYSVFLFVSSRDLFGLTRILDSRTLNWKVCEKNSSSCVWKLGIPRTSDHSTWKFKNEIQRFHLPKIAFPKVQRQQIFFIRNSMKSHSVSQQKFSYLATRCSTPKLPRTSDPPLPGRHPQITPIETSFGEIVFATKRHRMAWREMNYF